MGRIMTPGVLQPVTQHVRKYHSESKDNSDDEQAPRCVSY